MSSIFFIQSTNVCCLVDAFKPFIFRVHIDTLWFVPIILVTDYLLFDLGFFFVILLGCLPHLSSVLVSVLSLFSVNRTSFSSIYRLGLQKVNFLSFFCAVEVFSFTFKEEIFSG